MDVLDSPRSDSQDRAIVSSTIYLGHPRAEFFLSGFDKDSIPGITLPYSQLKVVDPLKFVLLG